MIVILFLTFLLGCQKIEETPHQNFNKPPDTFGCYSLGFPPPTKTCENVKLGELYFEPLAPHVCNGLVDSFSFQANLFTEDRDEIKPSIYERIKKLYLPKYESRTWTRQEAIDELNTTANNIAENFKSLGWDVEPVGSASWHLKFWSAERLLYTSEKKEIHKKWSPVGDEPPTWETTDYNIVLQIGIPSPCLEGY